MQHNYFFHEDCITESSRIVIDFKILFSLSCCQKSTHQIFFSANVFQPNNEFECEHIYRFKHARIIDLTKTTKYFNLNVFTNLERLIFSEEIKEIDIRDTSKLTYLENISYECNTITSIIDIQKCTNFRYLKYDYFEEMETLTNLQFLNCTLHSIYQNTLNFSLLSHLTTLKLILKKYGKYIYQNAIISETPQLIELVAENINFCNTFINGNKLKRMNMNDVLYANISRLNRLQTMDLCSNTNVNIIYQRDSFQCLTEVKFHIGNQHALLNFRNMTNVKFLDIMRHEQFEYSNLSSLISLEKLIFEHNFEYNIDIRNLTNLTYLDFKNHVSEISNYNISLPKNIICLFYREECDKNDDIVSDNTWAHKILTQINSLTNLNTLCVEKLLLNQKHWSRFRSNSLTKLTLEQCCFQIHISNFASYKNKYFRNLLCLKDFTLDHMNMKNVDTKYLSSVTKLILEDCEFMSTQQMNNFKSLEILILRHIKYTIQFDEMPTLTNLLIRSFEQIPDVQKLCNLKKLTLSNQRLFLELCMQKFPDSLRDIYVGINKNQENYLSKISVKGVNLHYI